MKRLLDDGLHTGMREFHDYNPLTDTTTISYEADTTPLLDLNKQLYNNGENGYVSKAREWKHVANIPNIVVMKWLAEEGLDIHKQEHWEAIRKKLNSNEFLYLRTSPGTI